ncbi:MAG: metallophosphoesterase family protein [Candidatus Heimdallarchaeaceae archaeon]
MNITALLLSDIHSQFITLKEVFKKILNKFKPNLCIISGDITNFGTIEELNKIIDFVGKYIENTFFVFGNCDPVHDSKRLNNKGVNLEEKRMEINNLLFIGFGSQNPKIDWKLLKKLNKKERKICLVTHIPPFGTELDFTSFNKHGGSTKVREVILKYNNIILSISGHIHESPAISKLNNCTLINPGPLTTGNFAILKIDKGFNVSAEILNINEWK